MKNILKFVCAFCLIILVSANISAQKYSLQRANKLYDLKAYAYAIPKYLQVLKRDTSVAEALIKVADCYRLTNDVKKSELYYSKVVRLKEAQPIHLYYYAQALMETGNYKEAEKFMRDYQADNRGKVFIKAIDKLNDFYKDQDRFTVKMAGFSSPENDFCPVFYGKKIVFVSARVRAQMISYTHPWTDKKYYFIYEASPDVIGYKMKLFANYLQNKFNDGPVCFSKDGKTMFLTRNNVVKNKAIKGLNGDVVFNLYEAAYDDNTKKFGALQPFPFNSSEYNTGHPAISPDGTKLYFTSDMPGGQGGMDLWVASKANGTWMNPVNLGPEINTPGNEAFPYVSEDGTLYFSSNGLPGIGGLDIFNVNLNEQGMPSGKPQNMGAPLNSMNDDFGITFNPDSPKGYLSSNRKNMNIDDDIYEFTVNKPEKKTYTILVMDSVLRKLLDSKIVITDSATSEKSEFTEKEGKYIVDLYPKHTYFVDATSEGYFPKNNVVIKPTKDNSKEFEILMTRIPTYFIAGTCYEIIDPKTNVKLDGVLVEITDNDGNKVYSHVTDASGTYKANDLQPNTRYTVKASKDGYYTLTQVVEAIPPEGAIRDFYFSKIVVGKAIRIENIYFDFDKSDIRPDAAVELDKIVKLLIDNPTIKIEIGSHTDCRGSKAYNEALSARRAKSSVAYIISQGIDKSRITSRGYGENMMLIYCPCEGALQSDCTEEQHQYNRRTEFKVTGFVKDVGNVDMKSEKGNNVIVNPKPANKI